ncbi:MAG TPA: alpha/beta fold hydrolase, partial [Sorangium sp.]|nr:alpha/beta fold hydrolase [Sorangium sp.]
MPQARVNGLDIEYTVQGRGEPLLLIMGLGAQLVYWPDGFCEALGHRGFQVIRFDNRDVGLSSKLSGAPPPDIRRIIAARLLGRPLRVPYLLDDMADDAAALITHLGIPRAHVLGVSMGGMIAQVLASRHPRRVATLTSVMSHAGQRRHMLARPAALRVLLGAAPRTREQAQDRAEVFYRTVGSRG